MATVQELLERLQRPIEVELLGYGTLRLRPLLDDEHKPLQEILDEGLSARELTISVIHWLLMTPILEREEVGRWTDEQLQAVIEAWSRDARGLNHNLPREVPPFEGFIQMLSEEAHRDPTAHLREELAKFRDNLIGTIHFPDLGSLAAQKIRALGLDRHRATFDSLGLMASTKDLLAMQYPNVASDAVASMQAIIGSPADYRWAALPGLSATQEAATSMLSVLGNSTLAMFDSLSPLKEAIAMNSKLYDSLAAPMPGLDQWAQALNAATSWLPDQKAISPLHDITRQLTSLNRFWQNSELESMRIGAGVLGQVTALAEQDWLLNWPPPEMLEHWKELDEAKQTLDKHGYGFTIDLWRWAFLRTLVRPVHPTKQGGVITRRLTKATQQAEFKEYMAALLRDLEKLPHTCRLQLKPRSRWKAIDEALDAHARRHYMASVPILLAQVDGMLTCLLLARGELWLTHDATGKKIYKGRSQQTGKVISANGLRKRLDCTQLQQDSVLNELKILLETKLDDRNGILHGDDTVYGTSKLSTQLVLVLAVLANELGNIADTYTKH